MEKFFDVSTVSQIALFMVGFTQVLKKFFDVQNPKIKVIISIIVGIAGSLVLQFAPHWIFTTLMGVSVGVIFYDGILKNLEKLFQSFAEHIK